MAKKQDKRKNPGQPMSDEERRNRPWLQINHHSIRMMVRRDNGGNPLEGMVWKSVDGTVSFKVINNKYLLKNDD